MGSTVSWLITILHGDQLLKCALKVERDDLPGDCYEYPMEPENRAHIHGLLPMHVRSIGPIVNVEDLFEVHIANT